MDNKNKYLIFFASLNMLFISSILLADIFTYKLVTVLGFSASLSLLAYPLSYAISDIITECYGKYIAIAIMLLGLAMELFFDWSVTLASYTSSHLDYRYDDYFSHALSSLGNVASGAIIAAFMGYIVNILMMATLQKNTSMKFFYRSIISSICGEVVFILIGYTIWFYDSKLGWNIILQMMLISLIFKFFFSTLYAYIGKYVVSFLKDSVI